MTETAEETPHPVKVWCFGDSLTEGLSRGEHGEMLFTPYSEELRGITSGQLCGVCHGVSGQRTYQVKTRLERTVLSGEIIAGDYVVILSGTNDVAQRWDREIDTVANEILEMAEMVVEKTKAIPVLVTIPALGARFDLEIQESGANSRQRLNGALAAFAAEKRWPLVDLHKSTSEEKDGIPILRPEYDADGLHLTKQGYSQFAELVALVILEHLQLRSAGV